MDKTVLGSRNMDLKILSKIKVLLEFQVGKKRKICKISTVFAELFYGMLQFNSHKLTKFNVFLCPKDEGSKKETPDDSKTKFLKKIMSPFSKVSTNSFLCYIVASFTFLLLQRLCFYS